jgi:imidazolonepropionase-like amidohydrolase
MSARSTTNRGESQDGIAEVIAIVGGTILDGNGHAPIENGVILVDGKRIGAIGERSLPIPPRAREIDATGKFIVPGVMAPSHFLVDGVWPPSMIRYEGRYDEVAVEAAELALKGGVTSIFDAWGPRDPLIKARKAINEDRVTAARIYLCGNWIGLGGPFSQDMRRQFKEAVGESFANRIDALWTVNVGQHLTRMAVEEARREVREYVRSGIDFVTYPLNAHRVGAMDCILLSPRVQRMIVEEAHEAGLRVKATFATTEEGIHLALSAGVDIVGLFPWGGRPMSSETLALIAEKGVAVHFVPFTTEELEWYRRQQNPSPEWLGFLEAADLDHRGLIGAGARLIAWGANIVHTADQIKHWESNKPPGGDLQLGEGHVRGLQALQEKGMTAMDALMTVTRNVARAYKVDRDLGTLERGKLADLVILDRNPLENPHNYLGIHLVMKQGEVIDRDALPSQRLLTAPGLGSSGRRQELVNLPIGPRA